MPAKRGRRRCRSRPVWVVSSEATSAPVSASASTMRSRTGSEGDRGHRDCETARPATPTTLRNASTWSRANLPCSASCEEMACGHLPPTAHGGTAGATSARRTRRRCRRSARAAAPRRPRKPCRIPAAVEPLVVTPDDRPHRAQRLQRRAQRVADLGMSLHQRRTRSAVSGPGFSSTASGTPTLPTSCR